MYPEMKWLKPPVSYERNGFQSYIDGDNNRGRKGYREYIEEGIVRDIGTPFDNVKGQIVLDESGFKEWLYEKVMNKSKADEIEQRKSNELVDEISQKVIIETVCKIFDVEENKYTKTTIIKS